MMLFVAQNGVSSLLMSTEVDHGILSKMLVWSLIKVYAEANMVVTSLVLGICLIQKPANNYVRCQQIIAWLMEDS